MNSIKSIARIALFSAILLVVQIVLAPLPNIELVSFLLLVFALSLPLTESLIICIIFTALEALCFGIADWVISYLLVWPLLVTICYLLRNHFKNAIITALVLGTFGLLFGSLCSIIIFVLHGFNAGLAYLTAGLTFDAVHAVSNFMIGLLLHKVGLRLVELIKSHIVMRR